MLKVIAEIKSRETHILTKTLIDEDGEPIQFKADENGKLIFYKMNGTEYLRDKKGEYIIAAPDDEGYPMRLPKGEKGVTLEVPSEVEYEDGTTWMEEGITYIIGNIINSNI